MVTKEEVIEIVGQSTQEILEAMQVYSLSVQAQFDALNLRIDNLEIEMRAEFALIHKELDGIHSELDGIHKELDEIRQRLSGLEANHADDRIASIREVNGLRQRIEVLEKTVKQLSQARN